MPPYPPMPPMPPYPFPPAAYRRRFPGGAIWLIGLGILFLLHNAGVFRVLSAQYLVPVLLIIAGVYNFIRRMTDGGGRFENDGTPMYSARLASALSGSAFIVLVGVLFLLNNLHILTWSHSWPFFLIVAGVVALFRRSAYNVAPYPVPPHPYAPTEPVPNEPTNSTEIIPTHNDLEGR